MRKKKLHNICFYIFKYILMLMPLILLLIVEIFPTKKTENYYNGVEISTTETETTINYNQLFKPILANYGGLVSSINDNNSISCSGTLTAYGNNYFNLSQSILFKRDTTKYFVKIANNVNNIQIGISGYGSSGSSSFIWSANAGTDWTGYISIALRNYSLGDNLSFDNLYISVFDLNQMGLEDMSINDLEKLFNLNNYTYNESQEITLSSLTLTNTISDNSNIVSSYESRDVNTALLAPFTSLYNLSVNNWYMDILDTIGLDTNNEITKYIACMPLWVLWVELFYLIGFCLSLIPKLFNRWLSFDD